MSSSKYYDIQGDLVIDSQTEEYTRTICTTKLNAAKKIEKMYAKGDLRYGDYKCTYIVPSGMNAIYLCLNTIYEINKKNKNDITFMFSSELYEDTEELIINNLIDKNVNIIRFDQTSLEDFKNKKNNIHVDCVFVESCSNPSGLMTDWNIFKYCDNDTIKIVDNTWLSPVSFNPFLCGSNIVVESCTKYISGGKCIAGHITFNEYNWLTELIENEIEICGSHVSPINCKIIDEMIDSIEERIKISSLKTTQILDKLKLNPKIKNIKYPYQMIHNKKYKYPPSVMYLNIETDNPILFGDSYKEHVKEIIKLAGLYNHTSYGKIYDTINNLKDSDINNDSVWLRLSIGYNIIDVDILYKKIEKIINDI